MSCKLPNLQTGSQIINQSRERETENRRYNYSDAAKYDEMVWACFKKQRKMTGLKMHEL